MLLTHRSNKWDKFLDTLNLKDNSIYKLNWKIFHKRTAYYSLCGPNRQEYTASAHVELFVDTYEHQFSPNNGPESLAVSATMQFISEATLNNIEFIKPGMIECLI